MSQSSCTEYDKHNQPAYTLPEHPWFIRIDHNDVTNNTVYATYLKYRVVDDNGEMKYYYYGGSQDGELLSASDQARIDTNNDRLINSLEMVYITANGFEYYKDGNEYCYYTDYRENPHNRHEILSDEDVANIDWSKDLLVEESFLFKPDFKLYIVYNSEEYSGQIVGENQIIVYDIERDINILYTLREETNYRLTGDRPGYLVLNKSNYYLPSSGGIGTFIFTLLGSMIATLAFVEFFNRRRQRKRGDAHG